jgi:transposase
MEKLTKSALPCNYSESFKRMVITEYESGLSTKATLKRKYCIAGNSCIPRWLTKYGKLDHPNYLSQGRPTKDKDKQYIKELEAKLRLNEKRLKKELKEKEDELKAYKQFLDIAERELNIKIVKKYGTKQSKK